jgi:hypothetical protein
MITKEKILEELIKLHSKYSCFGGKSNEASQLCTMWSTDDPPDVLETTDELEAICDLIDMDIDEDYALELYEMTLKEASDSLHTFLTSNTDD